MAAVGRLGATDVGRWIELDQFTRPEFTRYGGLATHWFPSRPLVPTRLVGRIKGGQNAGAAFRGTAHRAVSRQQRTGVRAGRSLRPPSGTPASGSGERR